jgi:protein phosphatase
MENYVLANCTDPGKVRDINEDSMVTFDSPNGRVVAVCDGMGGQNAGDVASQLAVTVIQDILTDNTFASPEEAITRSIIAANQAILRRAAQDVSLSGMGATCVMIIIKEGKVYFGSVGDSRIYYIAGGMIRQITKDQSYVQTLVDAGEITQEAAEHHQDKNQITNALGLDGMIPPVIGQMPITPEPGAVFLLCSDGLSGMINNNAILNTVANRQLSLSDRAQQLVNLANAAGGLDNITVQLVEFPGVASQNVSGYNPNSTSGGTYTSAKRKRSKMPFYAIAACLFACIIGGAIYWFLKDNEPDPIVPKSTISVKEKPVEQKTNKTTVVVKERTVTEKDKDVDELSEKERAVVEKGKSSSKSKSNKGIQIHQKVTGKEVTGKDGQETDNSDLEMKIFDGSKEEK